MLKRILLIFILSPTLVYAQEPVQKDSLVIGIKNTPPFIISENKNYTGISIMLWDNIASELDLDYSYKEYNTLEALLTALNQGEIDLSINPLTVTSKRIATLDFTQPFFITNLAMATTKEGQNKWLTFLKNFFSFQFLKVVILLLVVLMIFGILVWLFERKKNEEQFGGGWKGVWSGLWWSAVTMTTVGYGDKAPSTTGGRIVALVWMFTAIIIISGFTASIASALTVSSLEVSIKGPKDLKNFEVATVEASTGESFLERSNIQHQSVTSLNEALEMLNNGEIEVVVYDEPLLRYMLNNKKYSKNLMILEPTFATQYYSFALSDGNELIEDINPVLLQEINQPSWKIILKQYELSDE